MSAALPKVLNYRAIPSASYVPGLVPHSRQAKNI
ncbi:Uncharacterised protein [Legionella quinlivanii]|nr:Uncharacterised protein [Legionella quinlivanii]